MIYRVRERTLRTGCGAGGIRRRSDAGRDAFYMLAEKKLYRIGIQELLANAPIFTFGVSIEINRRELHSYIHREAFLSAL